VKYKDKKFDVPVGGDDYRDGWERIWGPKKEEETPVYPDPDAIQICTGCGGEIFHHFCHECGVFK
jgi:hypothetical protein